MPANFRALFTPLEISAEESKRDMTSTIDFDRKTADALERAYMTSDVVEQRRIVLDALDLNPGEHVLDVGPGPGLLLRDMAARVGPEGRVVGVELSEPMLAFARQRCADLACVELDAGEATELHYRPATFNAVVSTQVYEYVEDIPAAFAKLYEITRAGGRVAIVDTDYDSLVLHCNDVPRQQRILESWDAHFVHRGLPRVLGPELRRAGFRVRATRVIPILNTRWNEDQFSFHLASMMAQFATSSDGPASAKDAEGWLAELNDLGRQGDYFFSLNRYLVVADKPPIRDAEPGSTSPLP